jgi:glycosyltransferase involved in cell wall biosynthesis
LKISIVTVAYNSAATISDTLLSVATQTHPDVEHIVVDGASTDATMAVVLHSGGTSASWCRSATPASTTQ